MTQLQTMHPAGRYEYPLRAITRALDELDCRPLDGYTPSTSTYAVRLDLPDSIRFRVWFLESLHTALSHREPLIAFRALIQAAAYAERRMPDGQRVLTGGEGDWLLDARNRIEDCLRQVPLAPLK
jgi:hypothetical protein